MPEITLTLVPWAPTSAVAAYPRRSEQLLPDQPPTGVPAADTQTVAADASLTYPDLSDGDYWAAAPLNGAWRYVAFTVEPPTVLPPYVTQDDYAQGQGADDARLDAVESGVARIPAGTLAALAEPWFVPHRGGGLIAPDNSLNALRSAVDKGAKILDVGDVWLGADGALLCMHDSTVDRTTNGMGNTQAFTALGWRTLLIDQMVSQGWPTEQPPTLPDMLRVAKSAGCVGSPEAKTLQTTQPLCDALVAAGMKDQALVVVVTLAQAAIVKAAGIAACLLCQTNTTDPAPIIAAGVPYVGYPAAPYAAAGTTPTDAQLQALNAAGIKLTAFTLNRRKDWDAEVARVAALGITLRGLWSDDAFWVGRIRAPGLTDCFISQMVEEGMFLASGSTPGVTFLPSGNVAGTGARLKLSATAFNYQFIALGPLFQAAMPSAITGKLTFDVIDTSTSAYLTIGAGGVDDADFRTTGAGNASNGYDFRIRQSGVMECYRQDNGVAVFLANYNAAPSPITVANTVVPFRLERLTGVDAGKLKFTRTDTGHAMTTPVDSTYRGGALWFGKSPGGSGVAGQGSISDIVITP